MILHIKKKWFDLILEGIKKEEYREVKPFYDVRFNKWFNGSDTVPIILRNGYSAASRSAQVVCSIRKGYGKEEWGAEQGKEYYVLEIKSVTPINI